MSAMIRTLAKARLLNTGNQVMKQTMIRKYNTNTNVQRLLNTGNQVMSRTLIRKYNTNTNVQRQSKFRDIDKGKLFLNSVIVGSVVGAVAKTAKFYKDEREKGYQPDLTLCILEAMVGSAMGFCYFITIPAYLFTVYIDRQCDKMQQEIREKLKTDKKIE
jgi:hypothetical protein